MNNGTATETAIRCAEEDQRVNRIHYIHKRFRESWAPQDPNDRDEFEAELAMLLRQKRFWQ